MQWENVFFIFAAFYVDSLNIIISTSIFVCVCHFNGSPYYMIFTWYCDSYDVIRSWVVQFILQAAQKEGPLCSENFCFPFWMSSFLITLLFNWRLIIRPWTLQIHLSVPDGYSRYMVQKIKPNKLKYLTNTNKYYFCFLFSICNYFDIADFEYAKSKQDDELLASATYLYNNLILDIVLICIITCYHAPWLYNINYDLFLVHRNHLDILSI